MTVIAAATLAVITLIAAAKNRPEQKKVTVRVKKQRR
jgi:hypothetical protein